MARIEESKTRGDDASRERRSKKRKSPSDSDSSSSDGNRNRRRERRRERKEKSHRKRSSSKREKKKRRRGDDDSSSGEEFKGKDKRSKHKHKNKKLEEYHSHKQGSAAGVAETLKIKALSEEDYFSKNNEFSMWLKEERGMFFSNLSSEKTRKLFLEFINAWNSRQLRSEYYEGISSAPRTDHNWGFKIDKKAISEDPVEEREIAKKFEKLERKKYQKMQEVVLDELLPKATGRERMVEKRAINREQARGREESPELANDKDLMGGGDDFRARLDKERMRRQKKVMEKAAVFEEKLQASRQKEAAAMSQLQAIINEAGGKITIPKRS